MKKAVVTGAGGFVGSHYVKFLKKKDYHVIGVDVKKPEFAKSQADEFVIADLRNKRIANDVLSDVDELYMFAADMGGVGYINLVNAEVIKNNVVINVNSLEAAKINRIKKIFFASSACVYPVSKQDSSSVRGLRESDAVPAEPDTAYGWEKLFAEQACRAYQQDYRMNIRVARFHNVYGPEGTYKGGREKSPAAICRKVAEAKQGGVVEIWGDGKQTRSYCYIDDACEGVFRLMKSDFDPPINIGSDRLISITNLAKLVIKFSEKRLTLEYDQTKPVGVRGRNSDNTLLRNTLGWEPKTNLEEGMKKTYDWISKEVNKQ